MADSSEPQPPHSVQVEYFVREFSKESDRACVVLAAAMLDEALKDLLKARLVRISTKKDPLFDDPNAPLSTFSARIAFAFRVGLLGRETRQALTLIRTIRNDFAHKVIGCTFSDEKVLSRVAALVAIADVAEAIKNVRPSSVGTARRQFQFAAAWQLWFLGGALTFVEPLGEEEAYGEARVDAEFDA